MDSKPVESVRIKMQSLRMACHNEVPIQQQKMDSFTASFRDDLASIRATVQETLRCEGKLEEIKAKLREAEDELFKAIAVKTRKEARRMALVDAIAAKKARIEEIKRTVQEQTEKKDEYAAIISQSFDSDGKSNQGSEGEIEEAILWYNRVLGFHIEAGHGVKFTFKNISSKNPDEEFSFIVRLENDSYILLDCDPHVNEIKEMIKELNRTNGLFKFVRDMRLKFQEAAAQGLSTVFPQESSIISGSAPAFSVSSERSESLAKNYDRQVQYGEGDRRFKKPNCGKGTKEAILSPGSATYRRRSPRFEVQK